MSKVVITAYNFITPLGSSTEKIHNAFKDHTHAFKKKSEFNNQTICEVTDFDIKQIVGRNKNLRYLNRGAQFALATAYQTIRNSGLDTKSRHECGLIIGSGPNFDFNSELPINDKNKINWDQLSALWMLRFLPNTASSLIATMTDLHGENTTVNTACASGLQAIGQGYQMIKNGQLSCVLCGAGDSRLSTGGIYGYTMAQALGDNDDPNLAIRPFDLERNGFIPGEGGAFFLLEDYEHAVKRDATIICEVAGFSSTIDGYNMTAPQPDGKWAQQAILSALKDAKLETNDIDLISAHATGTNLNDEMEAHLIDHLFQTKRPLVIALKSWIGHLAAACGAAELAVVISCMKKNYFPNIRNLINPCIDTVNFLKKGSQMTPKTVLLQNFGFGGQNAVLIIRSTQV